MLISSCTAWAPPTPVFPPAPQVACSSENPEHRILITINKLGTCGIDFADPPEKSIESIRGALKFIDLDMVMSIEYLIALVIEYFTDWFIDFELVGFLPCWGIRVIKPLQKGAFSAAILVTHAAHH